MALWGALVRSGQDHSANEVATFGRFQFEFSTGHLRKDGTRLRVEDKPVQLLTMLLRRAGRVVTREELHTLLWPPGVHVDYDHGLNKSVNKLRFVLGDDPENPTFIETLPRVGYRFIGSVQIVGALTAPEPPVLFEAESPPDPTPAVPSLDSHRAAETAAKLDAGSAKIKILRRRGTWMWGGLAAAILVIAGIWFFQAQTNARHSNAFRSLAVLPLRDLSPVQGQEYFADGITEELITSLAQSLPLRVISRTSVMRYKQTSEPITQIARELGVDAIVEGAVTRDGNRVKVTLQLIDAAEDRHLWAHSYERDFGDMFGVEDELSREMSAQIGHNLIVQPQSRTTRVRSVDPKAYEFYLQGRYFWNKRTDEGMEKAAVFFDQAIHADPGYPQAYVGLADCYLFGQPRTLPPKELPIKAKEMAHKALELDDRLGEAHATLGLIAENFEWDWGGAEREYKRAIELNPNYATAHQWYGEYLAFLGRFAESFEQLKTARELDPLSLVIIKDSGEAYYFARKYDEAVEFYRKTLDMDSGFTVGRRFLAMAYLQQEKFSDAVAELQTVTQVENSPDILAELGYAYALSGGREKTRQVLHDLQRLSEQRYAPAHDFALVYAGLGDRDRAFEWLEKAYREHAGLGEVGVDPRWDSLRGDPRFADLTKRMGLPLGQ
jgi:TolB-like protein/DNA-binding winged helix-turn-helix (wHTH) protein/tetratricopeptide (TPR) repeat protein